MHLQLECTRGGAVEGKMSDAYVWSMRAPALRPGDVVIMDNLSVHKSQAACDAIKARHAECLFLPADSPDLGPSEKM